MSGNSELIRLEAVTKSYGKDRVLEIAELRFYVDECVAVYGANGSGKSTLLRIIAGISTPDRGRVWRSQDPGLNILGYVPQAGGLYDHLTVTQNILIRRRLYGLREATVEYIAIAREMGLERFMDRRITELSGGYQRLAAIVVALSSDPQWLLLDEPFSGLDPAKRDTLKGVLRNLSGRLRASIIAAPSLIESLPGDRKLLMEAGRIQWQE